MRGQLCGRAWHGQPLATHAESGALLLAALDTEFLDGADAIERAARARSDRIARFACFDLPAPRLDTSSPRLLTGWSPGTSHLILAGYDPKPQDGSNDPPAVGFARPVDLRSRPAYVAGPGQAGRSTGRPQYDRDSSAVPVTHQVPRCSRLTIRNVFHLGAGLITRSFLRLPRFVTMRSRR